MFTDRPSHTREAEVVIKKADNKKVLWLKPDSGLRAFSGRFWLLLSAGLLIAGAALAWTLLDDYWANPTTRIFRIGYENSPPYQTINPDGSPGGMAIEVINEACRRRKIAIEWVRCTGGPITNLTNGTVDLWPLVGDLPGRKKLIYISAPWTTNYCWMVSLERSGFKKPSDTAGREVWLVEDPPGRLYAETNFPDALLVGQTGQKAIFDGIVSGRASAGLIWGGKATTSRMQLIEGIKDIGLYFYRLPNGELMMGVGASSLPEAKRAADMIAAETGKMSDAGIISSIYFRTFLDPNNEIDTLRYQKTVQRHSFYMLVAISVLTWVISLLGFQTIRLNRARRAANAASKAKSDFLANMSHEIRTPLNGMIGMTELTLATELTAQQREYLGTACQSAETLLRLVNDILDFSKIEAGMMKLEHIPIDLEELIEVTARAFALSAHQKQLELTVELSAGCPRFLHSDPTRLRQVLFNLLGNAVKFTERGDVNLRVNSTTGDTGTMLMFTVADTGVGIPPGKEKALFAAFSQADTSTTRKYGGTGLGLVISLRLAKLMGGHIWHEKTPGGGATFHFSVPLVEADPPANANTTNAPTKLSGLRILAVDDHAGNRSILEAMLRTEGAKPSVAATLGEALGLIAGAHAADTAFDAILLDGHMPGHNVLELAQAIKADTRNSRCAIVFMLLADDNETLAGGKLIGIESYVTKPVVRPELIEAVARARDKIFGTREAQSRKGTQNGGALPVTRFPLRILVAEDNPVNLRVARALLERHGHVVTSAANGRLAINHVRGQAFDLILMDVQMPELDGIEATLAIRNLEKPTSQRVPIVAMTACAMSEDEERCLKAGMDAYLTKPINTRKLLEYLDTVQTRMEQDKN